VIRASPVDKYDNDMDSYANCIGLPSLERNPNHSGSMSPLVENIYQPPSGIIRLYGYFRPAGKIPSKLRAGPVGSIFAEAVYLASQSLHHSSTFPEISHNPYPFGSHGIVEDPASCGGIARSVLYPMRSGADFAFRRCSVIPEGFL
jgi:hypothetical protein